MSKVTHLNVSIEGVDNTQPLASWHLHFKPTNMVALKCFVPPRYQAPMRHQPLNIFTCTIHRVGRYASHTTRNPSSPYPGTHKWSPANQQQPDRCSKAATSPWQNGHSKIGWEPNDKDHACPPEPGSSITLTCTFCPHLRYQLAHPSPNASTPPHGRT